MDGPLVHALSCRLHEILHERRVDRIDVPADRWQANVLLKHCAGQTVRRVYSHGQWLLWDFSHSVSWVFYPLQRWRWSREVPAPDDEASIRAAADSRDGAAPPPLSSRPGRRRLLAISLTDGSRIVLSGRPLLLIVPTQHVWHHPHLARLGPDVFDDGFSPAQWVLRLRQASGKTIARALLDQRIAAGVGNPSKCEILFAARIHPATRVGAIPTPELRRMVEKAGVLLREASQAALRRSVSTARPWRVHDRAGEPCDVCAAPIMVDRCGGDGHWTWYCRACQAPRCAPLLFNEAAGQGEANTNHG